MNNEIKIFGIGMPKTGTTSLHAALEMLGFRALHFPHDPVTVAELRSGNYNLSILNYYDALSDVPIPAIYAQLDQVYPNSKFILTMRDVNDWIESCRNAWFNQSDAVPEPGTTREFYRTLLYGCNKFNENRFRWVYETHLKQVQDHFSDKKVGQLLRLDISGNNKWEKLCSFLEVNIPHKPFPHQNKRNTTQSRQSMTTNDRLRRIADRILGN